MSKKKREELSNLYDRARFLVDGAIELGDFSREEAKKEFGSNFFNKQSVISDAIKDGADMQSAREVVQDMVDEAKSFYAEKEKEQKTRLEKRKGNKDFRSGGMVTSTVDRRKNRG